MAPAIQLDGGEKPRIHPYERPLPEEDVSIAVAAAPTIRSPRRITIAGQR